MKYLLVTITLLVFGSSCRQKEQRIETDILKWEKAIVNLECQELRYSQDEIDRAIELEKKQGLIVSEEEELNRRGELGRETVPVSGTAIYLTDHGKKYLVTARHVIYDPTESKNASSPRLFKDISIRTPYEFFLKKKVNNSSIPSTGYGSDSPFYLSDESTDIGIISLQSSQTNFLVKTLEEDGYTPIEVEDVERNGELHRGHPIAAIGYPDISKVGTFQKQNTYQSNIVVLPVSTFGNVAMAHDQLSYFIADITVYPGNSGGPVIRENKLVGIVSGQVLIPVDSRDPRFGYQPSSFSSRGTLAKVTRSEAVLLGLKKLQQIEAAPSFR